MNQTRPLRGAAQFLALGLLAGALLIPALAGADSLAGRGMVAAAQAQVGKTLFYDPSYVRLAYPGGDIALERGVCADVVVRALRAVNIDLQLLIHQDMRASFKNYPQNWGLQAPDPNIDHRRVLNIIAYYKRQGRSLALPLKAENLRPGDLVAWTLPGNRPHIGVVSQVNGDRTLLVHNIGLGAQEEMVLFAWPISAHLRPLD